MTKFTEPTRRALVSRTASSLMLALGLLLACGGEVLAEGESVYRTGLKANRGWFAVSPDGQQLVIATDQPKHGMRMLDLHSGTVTAIPGDEGRYLTSPAWSPDGKQLALISMQRVNDLVGVDGVEIELADVQTWNRKRLVVGDGVLGFLFYSADGRTIYYSKGKRRTSGKTVASQYDLFGIDIASGRETQLTFEKYYQLVNGDDGENSILYSATSLGKDALGVTGRNVLYRYEKATSVVSVVDIDQSSGIFELGKPIRDKQGNIYFYAGKENPAKGSFLWFLLRANTDGRQIGIVSELLHLMRFDIARNTGEIFIMDKIEGELVIRRLATKAAH